MTSPEKDEKGALVAGLALVGLFTTGVTSVVLSVTAFCGGAGLASVFFTAIAALIFGFVLHFSFRKS